MSSRRSGSGSLSEMVPSGYQRSNEALFDEDKWDDPGFYQDTVDFAIDYLCTKWYGDRPDIGHVPAKDRLSIRFKETGLVYNWGEVDVRDIELTKGYRRFIQLLQNPQIRLILIPTSFSVGEDYYHRILLVIDKPNKRVEFYDPMGADEQYLLADEDDVDVLDAAMRYLNPILLATLGEASTPLMWHQSCSRFGFQAVEAFARDRKGEIDGYCQVWSTFLMELRIRYPELNPLEVQRKYMKRLATRAMPTLTLENQEIEELLEALLSGDVRRTESPSTLETYVLNPIKSIFQSKPALPGVLGKYFRSEYEAQMAAEQISKEFREFIKNYLSYMTKRKRKTKTSKPSRTAGSQSKTTAGSRRFSSSQNPFRYID